MEFLAAIMEAFIKMIIVATVAYGGILLGKTLRNKKDKKKSDTQ